MQDFERGHRPQVQVLAEVDFGKAPFTEQANEAIVAENPSYTAAHGALPLRMR